MHNDIKNEFGSLFKTLRLRGSFFTLQDLTAALDTEGLHIDPTLLSHWQRGARLPKDREIILFLLKVLIKGRGILSLQEANLFCASAGMGYLTDQEAQLFFPHQKTISTSSMHKDTLQIYFTASIVQRDELGANYNRIIQVLEQEGCTVQHEHITNTSLEKIKKDTRKEQLDYYKKFLERINKADIIVAEGSYPSTINIGHELTVALSKNKPVILFYQEDRNFFFLQGLKSQNLFLVDYTEENLERVVKEIFTFVRAQLS